MHPGRDGRAVRALDERADRQQLDHAAHLPGRGDVARGDLGDALAVDVGGGDPGVERQAGQDRCLGGGVEPLDVGGRVGLGVPERLGLLQRLGEAGAGGVHLVEDEVGGAVDDAEHPGDLVAGERLAQRSQDRDRTGDGGLVVEVAVRRRLGRGEQGRAVLGEQRLVGADDRGPDPSAARISVRAGSMPPITSTTTSTSVAGHQRLGVGGEQLGGQVGVALEAQAAYGDADELDRGADPGGQVVGLLVDQAGHLGTHDPAAQQGYADRALVRLLSTHRGQSSIRAPGPTSSLNRSSTVSRRSTTLVAPSLTATTGGRRAWL